MTVTTILHKLTRRYYCSSSSSLGLVQVQLSNAKKMQHKLFARSLTPSPLLSKNSSDTTSRTICTSTLCDAHLSLSSSSSVLPKYEHLQKIHMQQVRRLGRKAGRMGQHIKTLNEMAHRDEHEKAKAKRSKKGKRGAKDKDEMSAEKKMNYNPSEIPAIQEDENETVFNSGNSDDNGNSGDEDAPSLPSKEEVKTRMMKVVYAMEDSFRAIRGGEATPELFDAVQVKAYGSMTPLNGVAQVVINTPTMASITCFDPEVTTAVRDAVRDMAGMNFNPRIEEGVVIVPIPRVSAETRKALVKQLGKTAENTRQRIRRIRRGAQDVVKEGKDGKLEGISEDDAFRAGKDIDAATEEAIKALNEIVDKKQASVMNV